MIESDDDDATTIEWSTDILAVEVRMPMLTIDTVTGGWTFEDEQGVWKGPAEPLPEVWEWDINETRLNMATLQHEKGVLKRRSPTRTELERWLGRKAGDVAPIRSGGK